jgi:hypothetical protein
MRALAASIGCSSTARSLPPSAARAQEREKTGDVDENDAADGCVDGSFSYISDISIVYNS